MDNEARRVFGVSQADKVRLKQVYSATETSLIIL